MMVIVINVLRALVLRMFTEKMVEILVLGLLEKVVKYTDNTLTDDLFNEFKKNIGDKK